MHHRSFVAASLALTLVLAMPEGAHAEEREAPAQEVAEAAPPIAAGVIPGLGLLAPHLALARAGAQPVRSPLALFAPTPEEIRLSHGAKTAIIVTAIVVGALIVVGLVAISRPGHL